MPLMLDLLLTFAKIGLFTFGGGYAMIALIENACVEKKQAAVFPGLTERRKHGGRQAAPVIKQRTVNIKEQQFRHGRLLSKKNGAGRRFSRDIIQESGRIGNLREALISGAARKINPGSGPEKTGIVLRGIPERLSIGKEA